MTEPRLSVRMRLALLVGVLFLGLGLVLLVVAFLLVRQAWLQAGPVSVGAVVSRLEGVPSREEVQRLLITMQGEDRRVALREALRQSWVVLLVLTLLSMIIAWLMSGLLLLPVRSLLAHIRSTSEQTLGTPINLAGPADEFRDLGDAFDDMQERMRAAFDSQRRFSANAAHELRTPLTIMRAEAELLTSAPDATDRERAAGAAIVAVADRSTRLIEGLLALSRAEGALLNRSRLDLADLVGDVAGNVAPDADRNGIDLRLDLSAAPMRGDAVLLRHLLTNLMHNAVRYTPQGGVVEIAISADEQRILLVVLNSGPLIAVDPVEFFAPFRRGERVADGGVGLGLAVVQSVATAHDGTVTAIARQEGGLRVTVSFPVDPGQRAIAP